MQIQTPIPVKTTAVRAQPRNPILSRLRFQDIHGPVWIMPQRRPRRLDPPQTWLGKSRRCRFVRPVTHHYHHAGYTRALYLSNGDILLSGAEAFDPKNPHFSRVQCFLSVLDKSLTKSPLLLVARRGAVKACA